MNAGLLAGVPKPYYYRAAGVWRSCEQVMHAGHARSELRILRREGPQLRWGGGEQATFECERVWGRGRRGQRGRTQGCVRAVSVDVQRPLFAVDHIA